MVSSLSTYYIAREQWGDLQNAYLIHQLFHAGHAYPMLEPFLFLAMPSVATFPRAPGTPLAVSFSICHPSEYIHAL